MANVKEIITEAVAVQDSLHEATNALSHAYNHLLSSSAAFPALANKMERKLRELEKLETTLKETQEKLTKKAKELEEREKKCKEREQTITKREKDADTKIAKWEMEVKAKELKWTDMEKKIVETANKIPSLVNMNVGMCSNIKIAFNFQ
jgi:hypothetical protein